MRNWGVRLLKVIDDGFFQNQFVEIGALNGRCYSIRGSLYILSGGVDYKMQFEDIRFGVSVNRVVKKSSYRWLDSYVETSSRRYEKAMEESSLMDSYAKDIPLGNKKKRVRANLKSVERIAFIRRHIDEGLNVHMYYYWLRYSLNHLSHDKRLVEGMSRYQQYINRHLKFVKMGNLKTDEIEDRYKTYCLSGPPKHWWHQPFTYTLDIIR